MWCCIPLAQVVFIGRLGSPFVFSSGGFGIDDGSYLFTYDCIVLFVVGGLSGLYM